PGLLARVRVGTLIVDFTLEREGDEGVVEAGDAFARQVRPDRSEVVLGAGFEPGYEGARSLDVLAHPDSDFGQAYGRAGEPGLPRRQVRLVFRVAEVFEAQLGVAAVRIDFAVKSSPVRVHFGGGVADHCGDARRRGEDPVRTEARVGGSGAVFRD